MVLTALLNLWADLRAAHHLYWTLHWQAKGQPFYGDHLLFERLYKAKLEQIDGLAEIIAGHYGSDKLDPLKAWAMAAEKIQAATKFATPLQIAEMVTACAEAANDAVMSSDECPYPAGLSNFVSDLSTKNIGDIYLLKQRYK